MNIAVIGCGVKSMSVIHDVLQNLDAKRPAAAASPFPIMSTDNVRRISLWSVVGVSLLINIGLVAYFFWPQPEVAIELSPEVFALQVAPKTAPININATDLNPLTHVSAVMADSPRQENPPQSVSENPPQIPPALTAPMLTPLAAVQPASPLKTQPKTAVVKIEKTDSSKAMEKVLESVNNGNVVTAAKANQAMDANEHPVVRARLLMAANPDQVLPYLQRAVPDFMQDPDLLSIAAQSEQKQTRHNSAIKFYQQLIHLQPADARWRAGLAISLDALGNQHDALRLYELAIDMGNLPPALANFVQKRITVIKA